MDIKKNYHKEHNIQNAIRLWCGEHNYLCFRANVGKVRTANGRWFDTGLPEGFSDLFILANNTIYFCECKTLKGKQREDQINFQRTIEEHGYVYFIARSVEDVEEVIENGSIF